MIEKGIIKKIDNNFLYIEIQKTSACSKCNSCLLSNKKNDYNIKIKNTTYYHGKYKTGDEVNLFLSTNKYFVLFSLFFLFPIFAMVISYYITDYFFEKEFFSIAGTFTGLTLSFIILYLINKKSQTLQNKFSIKLVDI